MKTYAQALDLVDDPKLIQQYEQYHKDVWPDVLKAIRHVGIVDMKIYRVGNRMFMLMTTTDEYDSEQATAYLAADETSQKWEALMDKFQQNLPNTPKGKKWLPMTCCFDLSTTSSD